MIFRCKACPPRLISVYGVCTPWQSNRLVTNPSSLRIVLPALISHSECRAVVGAAAARAADPGAPAAMPSMARVSSANRPAPWGPAFIAVTAAGPGLKGRTP